MKLNLGCGKAKYPGFINVDIEPKVEPDLVCDFRTGLPYEKETVDTVLLIHAIEHIEVKHHFDILSEVNRVLKVGGYFVVAYPEFARCAMNYINNYHGQREFWRNTLYGRQLYPADYHVSLMDTEVFSPLLLSVGFTNIQSKPEPAPDEHNTIVVCQKGVNTISREVLLNRELYGIAQ